MNAKRSTASRKGWDTRKRMASARSQDPQAMLEARMRPTRALQGTAQIDGQISIASILERLKARETAPPPST